MMKGQDGVIEKVCIVCPIGCHLEIKENKDAENGYDISGNKCPRGYKYGIAEMVNPTRVVTSTVKIKGLENVMLPVKTTDGIPKDKMFELMESINDMEVELPIHKKDVLISNLFGTEVDLVATRTML